MNLRYVTLFAALPLSNALAAPLPIPPSPPAYDAQKTEVFWNKIGTADSQYSMLLLQPKSDTDAYVYQDIDNAGDSSIFKTIFLDGSSDTSKPTYTLNSVISEKNLTKSQSERTVSTTALWLKDVNFRSKAPITFVGASSNSILLDNSEIYFDSSFRDAFPVGSSLLIEGLNGTSKVTDFYTSNDGVKVDATIRVVNGAKLIYGTDNASTSSTTYRYDGNFSLDLQANSEFDLYYYKLRADQGVVNMASGSTFTLTGEAAHFTVQDMNLDRASYLTGGTVPTGPGGQNYTTVRGTLTLNNSSITMGEKHEFDIGSLAVAGTSTIESVMGGNRSSLTTNRIMTADSNSVIMNLSNVSVTAGSVDVESNLTINALNDSSLSVADLVMNGGTMNVGQGSNVNITNNVTQNSGTINLSDGALQIDNGVLLNIDPSGFNLNDGILSANRGAVAVSGTTLPGTGNVVLNGGTSPGFLDIGGFGSVATLSTDASVKFFGTNLLSSALVRKVSGLLDGGGMKIDVGATSNDVLEYGAGNVDIAQIKTIEVGVVGAPHPGELIGKSYDVIKPQTGASGTINIYGQDLSNRVAEASNVPVLVDFELQYDGTPVSQVDLDVTDSIGTLTLVAKEADNISLSRNPNLSTRNHQKVAALVPVTVPTLPTNPTAAQVAQHTVATAMQTLTNQNVAQDFTSVHPEVVASSMTVQLEQADQMLNTLLSVNSFSPSSDADDALASGFLGGIETGQNGVWGNVSYIDGKIDGQQDLGDFNYYLSGVSLGSTFFNRGETYLGSFFSVNQQTMSGHELASSNFKGDGYHLGVYGGLELSPRYQLSWVWGHGWNSTEYDRITGLNTISEQAKGEFDSDIDYLGFRVKRDTSWLPEVESNIFTGLAYLRSEQEAYSETNATNLGLTFDRSIAHAFVASLGVNAKRELSEQTRAHVLVRYDYDFEADDDSEHTVNAAFTHTPDNRIGFVGQNRGAHTLSLGLGAGHTLSDGLDVSLAGLYAHSDHGREIGGEATLNWAF